MPTSRTARLAARARAAGRSALRRIAGRPPSDWAGPDMARRPGAADGAIERDDRHEIVCLPGADPPPGAAARGHRVFTVSAGHGGPDAFAVREAGPHLFRVAVSRDAAFEGIDALRRDLGLGATVCFPGSAEWRALAERLRAERAWAIGAGSEAAEMARAFPRLSVVVVTYDNRELNRLCLESLLARTEWPHREILVSDNASTDGTPEMLAALAARHADLRILAHDRNLGFPAAVNAGLAAATGDILVILNNDVVVPRGWATALIRHLRSDPRLGLVGPVTNAIANEARVEVGYRSPGDMPEWAAAWMRRHDGETFPISMLAFFCVAMRREVFEDVGPLDERFGAGLFEDGDYNRRARARGWEVRCARDAFVHHWQMASFRRLGEEAYRRLFEENRRKFEEKWGPGG